ncbi:MAG: aminotransferase class III-fold pyridoxal phosphate-dependent enzyme [Variovorax sp.]|nr:MAG: aminotransferase class III-fold pyridoxal phosphate-dependent enzyme [Variovorax sp.]
MSATTQPTSPHVMNTYGRLPIALSHGQGCRVWDTNGKAYLDGLGGIAVNTLGHNHPELVPALQDQLTKIIHSSNYYHVPGQEKLASKLVELSGMTNAFFCCTGLEANEAALKLARKFGHDKGIERPEIVVYEHVCDERDWLMMIDEVQCGMGRTGKWFAHQWAGIVPDVMPLAKGLGSGVPIGAVVAGPRAAHIFGPGNHGTTFGGNPLAMRAGVETIRIMEEQKLLDNAATVGAHLKAALEREFAGLAGVKEVRGAGLMLGIELDRPCGVILNRACDAGLLLSVTADSVIRLVPPLILSIAEADEIVAILAPLVKAFLEEPKA